MGIKDKMINKAMEGQTKKMMEYMEALGAYLEHILETNREILNEIREERGKERISLYEDEEQSP